MSKKTLNIGIIMDPITGINTQKDSSFAMMLEAQQRGWNLWYMEQNMLWSRDGIVYAQMQKIQVEDNPTHWFDLATPETHQLSELDAILMRKDPPFDMEYIYTTYLLELAQQQGVQVINDPAAVRAANEKLFTAWFPECCPTTLVTRDLQRLNAFIDEQQHIVVKPLDGMGGKMIFQLKAQDHNRNVILETITDDGKRSIMAQRFLPEYRAGDKRILLINGEPFPYALARIPAEGEARANLAAGGTGKGVALSTRDYEICQQLAPTLKKMGLIFVGLDVIGDWLTEINVTSPTCIRELDTLYSANISGILMDYIEHSCAKK